MEEVIFCFLKRNVLFLVCLVVFCCLHLTGAAEENNSLERIQTCGTKCSQGLDCRSNTAPLFPPPCRSPPQNYNTSSVFPNVSLSTVMKCEERQRCSLHLRIQTRLRLKGSIDGVSVCTESPGLITNCKVIRFSRDSRQRLSGSLVEIENDCTIISPSQDIQITVKTFPPYCGTDWTGVYTAPDCTVGDLQSHVPECISKLSYKVNLGERSLTVSVNEALEGHNYILRLCYAKEFICMGTGAAKVIKKEDPVKTATLTFSRVLPCLCIEGWSAITDARRVQVCPFTQRVEELWSGISFDPMEASLLWQASCPVTATITLCQNQKDNVCIDLPHATHNVTKQKVKFIGVDPHPQLCMKFALDSQAWIRCPFANGQFPAWELTSSRHPEGVSLLSPTPGNFSVELCAKPPVPLKTCHTKYTRNVNLKKHGSVFLDVPTDLHGSFCLKVKRGDVKFSVTFSHCFDKPILPAEQETSLSPSWIILSLGVMLAVIILTTLSLHIWLTVHQRRTQKGKQGPCLYEKKKDCGLDSDFPALQSESSASDSDLPQCKSNEKANLLSD